MFVPAPCTLLFYRDAEDSLGAFRQRASYVFDEEPDPYSELDSGGLNFECTKRPMIMALWTLWAMHGRALFAEKIEYLCALTEDAHRIIGAEADFETLHRPEANILCFRHLPPGLGDGDVHRFQVALRNRIKREGTYFISKVDIDGVAALRVVMMNHLITADHIRALLDEIRRVGRELLASAS
jgi:L-2,4-diaminobutyrate decarboxylase